MTSFLFGAAGFVLTMVAIGLVAILRRPAEVDLLLGDASKAKKILGWEPKVRFHELVRIMVDADMDLLSRNPARKHLGKLP